jgi:hypothetical protein
LNALPSEAVVLSGKFVEKRDAPPDFPLDVPNRLPEIFLERPLLAGPPEVFDGVAQVEAHVLDDGDRFYAAGVRVVMAGVVDSVFGHGEDVATEREGAQAAMKLKEIEKLNRERQTGDVPMEILQRLRLPMPDDVLEQFVHDHGRNPEFQDPYGEVDLHRLEWDLVSLPAAQIVDCSKKSQYFAEHVTEMSDQMKQLVEDGWDSGVIATVHFNRWKREKKWDRAPVFLEGKVLGESRALHLVEGHTRVGRLEGLVRAGVLAPGSKHEIWLGRHVEPGSTDGTWKSVMVAEKVPFGEWLFDSKRYRDGLKKLEDVYYDRKNWEEMKSWGFEEVLHCVRSWPDLADMEPIIQALHAEWAAVPV